MAQTGLSGQFSQFSRSFTNGFRQFSQFGQFSQKYPEMTDNARRILHECGGSEDGFAGLGEPLGSLRCLLFGVNQPRGD